MTAKFPAAARLYRSLAFGWLAVKAATLLVNALTFPRLRPQPVPPNGPRVSILIPARNEAHNLTRTLPTILQQGAAELLLLDDHSTDHTADLAAHLGAQVIHGQPLPPGWAGKPWACQQLLQAANGEILIFTDADVTWQPGALGAVLHELQRSGADLCSVQPRQDNHTLGERLLTPLVDHSVLCYFPYPLVKLPQPAASMSNGQVMAFRRATLTRLGGYHPVRHAVLEDVQMARQLKAHGGQLTLALGAQAISVRMYRSYPQSVAGFSKNVLPLHLNSRPVLLLSAAAHLAVYTLPWLVRLPGWPALRAAGLLERPLVNWLTGRRTPADLAEGFLLPIAPILALPVYRRALRRHVTWKGRQYQQK